MKTADMDNKVLGNLDYYTDKKVYSTDQFKSDYKDFVKHRKLIIQKRQNKETNTVTWKSKDQSKLKLSKQGHDNFQALCIISASRWFNANIPLIKNKDTLSNILTYSEDNNSVDFRLSYSVKNKNQDANDIFPESSLTKVEKSIEPKPNRLVGFLNTPDSYHGITPMKSSTSDRLFIYISIDTIDKQSLWPDEKLAVLSEERRKRFLDE